jgi:hypothetical protein
MTTTMGVALSLVWGVSLDCTLVKVKEGILQLKELR